MLLPPMELREWADAPEVRGFLPERATFWPAEREGPAVTAWRRAIVRRKLE